MSVTVLEFKISASSTNIKKPVKNNLNKMAAVRARRGSSSSPNARYVESLVQVQ